jgi:hypothetical protein
MTKNEIVHSGKTPEFLMSITNWFVEKKIEIFEKFLKISIVIDS